MPLRIDNSTNRNIGSVGNLLSVGFSFVLAVVLGAWVGYLLDRWLGTSPWLFLLLFFLGLAAGIRNVYKMSSKFWK